MNRLTDTMTKEQIDKLRLLDKMQSAKSEISELQKQRDYLLKLTSSTKCKISYDDGYTTHTLYDIRFSEEELEFLRRNNANKLHLAKKKFDSFNITGGIE